MLKKRREEAVKARESRLRRENEKKEKKERAKTNAKGKAAGGGA